MTPRDVDWQYVYGIVGAPDREGLLIEISEKITELENQYDDVDIVSISHCIERAPGAPVWTALITAEVFNL